MRKVGCEDLTFLITFLISWSGLRPPGLVVCTLSPYARLSILLRVSIPPLQGTQRTLIDHMHGGNASLLRCFSQSVLAEASERREAVLDEHFKQVMEARGHSETCPSTHMPATQGRGLRMSGFTASAAALGLGSSGVLCRSSCSGPTSHWPEIAHQRRTPRCARPCSAFF